MVKRKNQLNWLHKTILKNKKWHCLQGITDEGHLIILSNVACYDHIQDEIDAEQYYNECHKFGKGNGEWTHYLDPKEINKKIYCLYCEPNKYKKE